MGQTQTHNAIACFVPSSNNGIKGTVKFYQNGKCEIKLQMESMDTKLSKQVLECSCQNLYSEVYG